MDTLPEEVIEIILLKAGYGNIINFCFLSKRHYLLGKQKLIPLVLTHLKQTKNWYIKNITLERLKVLCNDITYNRQNESDDRGNYTIVKGKIIKYKYPSIQTNSSTEFMTDIMKIFRGFYGEILYIKYDGTVYNMYGKISGLENIIYISRAHSTYLALSGDGKVFVFDQSGSSTLSYGDVVDIFYGRDIYFLSRNGKVTSYTGGCVVSSLENAKQMLYENIRVIVKNDHNVYYCDCEVLSSSSLTNIKQVYGCFYYCAVALTYNNELILMSKKEIVIDDLEYEVDNDLFHKTKLPIKNVEKVSNNDKKDLCILTYDKCLYVIPISCFYRNKYEDDKVQLTGNDIDFISSGIRIDDVLYEIDYVDSKIKLLKIS
jgi:hypothetical protein